MWTFTNETIPLILKHETTKSNIEETDFYFLLQLKNLSLHGPLWSQFSVVWQQGKNLI